MTEKSWPWSTVAGLGDGASELGEANSREFLALYFGVQDPNVEGVCKGLSLGELEVSGVATPLSVDRGAAICYGLYINDAVKTLAVSTPALGTTGGRVVLQTNWAGTGGAGLEARTRLAVIMSPDGNPAIPALTQAFGTTWEISLATFTITTGGVITVTDDRTFRRPTTLTMTDDIDDNAVDDTKVGNRVAQFYRRQGGNATNWDTPGSTDYTPTAVRKQLGVRTLEILSGNYSASVAITFPVAFSVVPAVKIGIQGIAGTVDGRSFFGHASGLTAAGFTLIAARSTNPASQNDVTLVWEATGTE